MKNKPFAEKQLNKILAMSDMAAIKKWLMSRHNRKRMLVTLKEKNKA